MTQTQRTSVPIAGAELSFHQALREVVGYLNFSSGSRNPRFFAAINRVFAEAAGIDPQEINRRATVPISGEIAARFQQMLREAPVCVSRISPSFGDVRQAEAVIALALDAVIPGYRDFHADLLGFHEESFFYQPFFVARILEGILQAGEPWEEKSRVVSHALRVVNDYVGYRPVPVLETRRYEPYPRERVCPVPIYIQGAGVACGPYQAIVASGMTILHDVPEWIARQADFDFDQLEELAFDPRALDFQHPVQHRPNYVYGSWDLHRLNQNNRFCRYVCQQSILDFLTEWAIEQIQQGAPAEETVFQAAAVFASTALMAMGVTGGSPSAIPSTENLGRLVVKIALYREQFYEWLRQHAPESVRDLLEEQFKKYRSYFAEVRRALNRRLNDYRAQEAHRGRFVQLLAELGQQEIVARQLDRIHGASGRTTSRIYAAIHACRSLVDQGDVEGAVAQLPAIFNMILRGIDCGGLVDPWNVLGFAGMFPLAPSPEDSIPDDRMAQLIMLVERLFDLHAQVMKAAAAAGKRDLVDSVNKQLRELAEWWDQFATTKVSEVISFSGRLAQQSAEAAARAMAAWYEAGAASGDVAFWRQHVHAFPSAKAFASVADTLLDHGDLVSSLALMIQWASVGQEIGIREGSHHLPAVAARWIHSLWEGPRRVLPEQTTAVQRFKQPQTVDEKWQWTKRFFDYLEANAGQWWEVPNFALSEETQAPSAEEEPSGEEAPGDFGALFPETFAAAYEGVVFRESALDGIDSDLLERRFDGLHSALLEEVKRLSDHAFFLACLGAMWQYTALQILSHRLPEAAETVPHWIASVDKLVKGLKRLAGQVLRYPIMPDSPAAEDMAECGMRLQLKEVLLARIVEAWAKLEEARWMLAMTLVDSGQRSSTVNEYAAVSELFVAAVTQPASQVRRLWRRFVPIAREFSTCYRPIDRGGSPEEAVAARVRSQLMARLLAVLPRRGFLRETFRLLHYLLEAERKRESVGVETSQLGPLFFIVTESLTRALVISAKTWSANEKTRQEKLTEALQALLRYLETFWRKYNGRLLLSPLERFSLHWEALEELYNFIRRFGRDLFTQAFMNYNNLVTVIRMGPANYIRQVIDSAGNSPLPDLFEQIRHGTVPLSQAAAYLSAILEPILIHYTQYIDYNASTTESDRGENLHILLRHLLVIALVDRVTWGGQLNLIVYRTLLRLGESALAEVVRGWWEEKIQSDLDSISFWLQEVEKVTGVQLATVRRTVSQAATYPIQLEQLRHWTRLLAEATSPDQATPALAAIEALAEQFLREPRETGFEEPEWIDIIRQEFNRREKVFSLLDSDLHEWAALEDVPITFEEVVKQCKTR